MGTLPPDPRKQQPPCTSVAACLSLSMFLSLLIFMQSFESINCIKISLNFKLLLQKKISSAGGSAPRPPKLPLPPSQISGLRA